MQRIDEAVGRILTMKKSLGLFEVRLREKGLFAICGVGGAPENGARGCEGEPGFAEERGPEGGREDDLSVTVGGRRFLSWAARQ